MAAFEALAVATAMPVVEKDLGGLRLYGLVFSGFTVANLVGAAYAGLEADRRDPAMPFAAGLCLFGAGLVIGGVAPSMEVVVAARCVQGLGSGMIATLAYVGIGRGYDEALRPRMFAVLSSAWVVPGLVGPALAGAVADHISWRLVFLGILPLLPLAAVLTIGELRKLAPQNVAPPQGRRLEYSLVLAAGAVMALAGSTLDEPLLVAPLVAIGLIVAVIGLRVLLPKGTFVLERGLPAAVAVMGLICLAFFGAEAFLPLALNEVRGQSPTLAGLALTAATLTWTAGAWVQAQRATQWSRRGMVGAGFVLVALGVAIAGSTASEDVPVVMAAVGWAVGGLGMGIAYSNVSVTILAEAPPDQEGYASASLQLASVLGVAVGTGMSGAIVSAGDAGAWSTATSIALAFALMAAFALIAAAGARRLPAGRAA
jgi:MFS family permease